MNLSPEQIELLRRNLLLQLLDVGRAGAQPNTLHIGAQAAGFNVGRDEIIDELTVLSNKGLVLERANPLNAVNTTYTITDGGREHLDRSPRQA